jgi:prolyl oligopeptidase
MKVVDPYRYMENVNDPEVQAWMKAQNDYTRAMLARIPGRQKLLARMQQLHQVAARVSVERLPGDRYLLLQQGGLYVREGLNGTDKLLVDPGKITLAPAGRGKGKPTIAYFPVSPDGKYVAVGITPGGSEPDTEIHVFETDSGNETGDVLLRAFTTPGGSTERPSWLPDSHSFVYGRFKELPPGNVAEMYQNLRTYLHVLGRDPAKDPAVFGSDTVPTIHVDPRYVAGVQVVRGSAYAVGQIRDVSPNRAVYIEPVSDLAKTNSAWRKVADFSDDVGKAAAPSIAVHGDDLYLLTYKNAPRYKVIRTDARKPDLASAETVVPPGEAVVTGLHAAQDALYVELLDGGINRVLRVPYGPKPKVKEVALPFTGHVTVQTDPRVPGALLGMTSWTRAYRIEAYDPKADRVTDTGLQPVGPDGNPSNIESLEVKVPSHDGTLVPLSIVHPKGMKLDGSNPTLLNGYGAYGFSSTPSLVVRDLVWTENGGVSAVCHVRGGGEYGEPWHEAGKGTNKPNTWRDFIACAQYLIDHKYTSPGRLAGWGTSAGGITIGRAITERPELFAAAIDDVGVSDTVRFEAMHNGGLNIPEFGSTATEAGFNALYAMSPYAHVKNGTPYPAVLLITGMNDVHVIPWQMAKMAARLQAATASGKPVLLRVDWGAGHVGGGGGLVPDIYSFLLWQMGVPLFQPREESVR